VAGIQVGFQYASLLYEFKTTEQQRVNRAAQQLADDVKAIMLNSGGPTAARTIYPIIDRNYQNLGLAIAVVPSELTQDSIEQTFKFKPLGLQPKWAVGQHNEASIALPAEQFCLSCHVKAKVGDTLGTVTIRSYLQPKEDAWWQDFALTASVLSLKIVLHTVVLFLLLKSRMEPLLSLRSTTAALAKGVMNLSPRAQVNSVDEFGELAADLNHFLDRVKLIVHDLDKILSEVLSAGKRLSEVNRDLEQKMDGLHQSGVETKNEKMQRDLAVRLVAARETGAFDVLVKTLKSLVDTRLKDDPAALMLHEKLAELSSSFTTVTEAVKMAEVSNLLADKEASQYVELSQSLREMALLEGSMLKVAESGKILVQRLEYGRSTNN